jgi:hypothetical protein
MKYLVMLLTFLELANSTFGASGISATDSAPMFGINPANTNVSQYVGITANPQIIWDIPHLDATIGMPALVLDTAGILYSQNHSPV